MKTYTKLLTLVLTLVFGLASCVIVPSGTPAQQVDQTYANAAVANGAGLVLLGTAATVWSLSHHDRYYYNRPYYRGYSYGYPRYYNRGCYPSRYYYRSSHRHCR